jgi:hypothetical protein
MECGNNSGNLSGSKYKRLFLGTKKKTYNEQNKIETKDR